MIKSRRIDAICCVVLALMLVVTCLFINGDALGITALTQEMGYENKLFDDSKVHTLDIVVDDWEGFLETCTDEEYIVADLVIDGEAVQNVGLRAKGNTSLTSVASYGNDRYSFKIEVDHYDSGKNYYGLDKFCLNNIIQDNTYLKDYLVYTMMGDMGVASPLCSFVYITVNGEDWGLYLAVEGVEESFLTRNYGTGYGELYKPDSASMGGGKGNGKDFNMEEMDADAAVNSEDGETSGSKGLFQNRFTATDIFSQLADLSVDEIIDALESAGMDVTIPDTVDSTDAQQVVESLLENTDMRQVMEALQQSGLLSSPGANEGKEGFSAAGRGGGGGGMSSEDTLLQYIDDDPESYSNIFSSAKTDITEADEQRLISSLKTLSDVVSGTVDAEQAAEVVDIETVIRYFVVHNFVCNDDSYTGSIIHNYYLYEEDGVMEMIPWDYNLAFGGFGSNGGDLTAEVNSPIDTPVSGEISERPMIAWIFADEEYTNLYHQIYAELIEKWFDSGYFEQLFDDVVALISPYVEKDPTAFCSYDEFTEGTQTLREFCLLRADSVSGQLEGTIPSTEDGQNQDSSALIDASALDANAMGGQSMGGQPMGGNRGNMQVPGAAGSADGNENNSAAQPSAPPDNMGTENNADNTSSEAAEPQQPTFSDAPPIDDLPDDMPSDLPEDTDAAASENVQQENTAQPDLTALQTDAPPSEPAGGRGMQPGNTMPGDQTSSVSPYQWIWVAASIGILLVGLVGTKLYTRW